jgi:hypothetical protein
MFQGSFDNMAPLKTESQLAKLCFALVDCPDRLSYRQLRLARGGDRADVGEHAVEAARKEILAGNDPLGRTFCSIRSSNTRRALGAVYTPPEIVEAIINWVAARCGNPVRVIDPGSGSGRFLLSAARRFPDAELIAVDVDPLAHLMLHANASVLGVSSRIRVIEGDYAELELPVVEGRSVFIGNPPFVRHHQIAEGRKTWFAVAAKRYGYPASKLAGLHIHFMLKTRMVAKPGDVGCFITASEWIDVNYGKTVKAMLADGLGGIAVQILDSTSAPFEGAMTTGAVTCFEVGSRNETLSLALLKHPSGIQAHSIGRDVRWSELNHEPKWSVLVRNGRQKARGEIELGELFRVHRGQVTGANDVWIEGPSTPRLPRHFLYPAITRGKELYDSGSALLSCERLRRVIDLPADLGAVSADDLDSVRAFLGWAEARGAASGFVARSRRAWWSVGLRSPAPILCTYMARRPPRFVLNSCEAQHLNIAHGLYPRQPLSAQALNDVVSYLNGNVCSTAGRTYAGGLLKFEPKEVERLPIPVLPSLAGLSA